MNRPFRLLAPLIICSALLHAGAHAPGTDPAPPGLSDLAAIADLVALVQVKDTDYVYTRSFPSGGSAFLQVLIAYKPAAAAGAIIEVREEGLHPNECYFESPGPSGEGRRYLVFLRRDPQDAGKYRGLAQGCALEALVTADSRYVLKYPLEGMRFSDRLEDLVLEYEFRDRHALIEDDAILPARRDELLARARIRPYLSGYKYTSGIDLGSLRRRIGAEALESPGQPPFDQRPPETTR